VQLAVLVELGLRVPQLLVDLLLLELPGVPVGLEAQQPLVPPLAAAAVQQVIQAMEALEVAVAMVLLDLAVAVAVLVGAVKPIQAVIVKMVEAHKGVLQESWVKVQMALVER
jgi:hypothetical protein